MKKRFNALAALIVAFVVGLTLVVAGGTSAMGASFGGGSGSGGGGGNQGGGSNHSGSGTPTTTVTQTSPNSSSSSTPSSGESASSSTTPTCSEVAPKLTVHKYTTPAGEEGNGTEKAPSDAKNQPVEGVEYTVYKVKDVDLNTNAGWLKANQMQADFQKNPSLDTLKENLEEKTQVVKTDSKGNAVFTFKPCVKGLYVVVESSIAGAKVGGNKTQVVSAKPFMVAVPMTDRSTHTSWNYDVHVYPKNAPVTAGKTVKDDDARVVGATVTFTITTDIPAATGTALNKYVVLDKLNTKQYTYKSVDSVTIVKGDANSKLTVGTDKPDKPDYSVSQDKDSGVVKVTFTADGLKQLEAQRGGHVVTVLSATIVALPDKSSDKSDGKSSDKSDGTYANTAYVVPSDDYSEKIPSGGESGEPGTDGKLPPIPSNTVNEEFAQIVINKTGTDGKTLLKDATFELYTCSGNADNPTLDKKPLTIGETSSFTTNEKGTVTINAVRRSDFYNGTEQTNHQLYCLKETKAPEGYELLPKPVQLDITKDTVKNGVFTVKVKDVQYNASYHLPLTGSNSAILLGIVGVLLLGGGVILVARNRQRS